MSSAKDLLSEDSDSISFNSFSQSWIQVSVITNNVDRTAGFLLKEFLGIHKQERVWCTGFDKDIHITSFPVLASGCRAEQSERNDAIIVLQCLTATLNDVNILFLTHSLLFFGAKLADFSDSSK